MKRLWFTLIIASTAFSFLSAQNQMARETLVYSVKEGRDLHPDKYVDRSVEYDGKGPVMIYVHGGGFTTGSRINALQIKYNKHFAGQGFVSFSLDYRLGIPEGVPQADHETVMQAVYYATEDLIDATAFILSKAEEWNIDTEKIMISGGSAGAITI